jgi:hypothetical protein
MQVFTALPHSPHCVPVMESLKQPAAADEKSLAGGLKLGLFEGLQRNFCNRRLNAKEPLIHNDPSSSLPILINPY